MKKTSIGLAVSVVLAVILASCSGSNYNNLNQPVVTHPTFRAFVSDPVAPISTAGGPAAVIVDAATDVLSGGIIPLASGTSVASAGLMALSPKKDRTLIFSPGDNKVAVIGNPNQTVLGSITLPGPTASMVVASDSITGFAAVPAASVTGQSTGAVVRMDISTGATTATIPVPAAHYLVQSPSGNQILVFSDNLNSITLLTPALIATSSQSNTQLPCSSVQVAVCTIAGGSLDRPISAVFNSSSTTAYIMNCGPECGGAGVGPCLTFTSCTSVSVLDMTQSPPALGNSVAVPAATIGVLQGVTLYVAGTPTIPADSNCSAATPPTTAAACGRLTAINTAQLTTTPPVTIADGTHDRMQMGANNQLFVGSRNCTDPGNSGGAARGCLNIVNATGAISDSGVVSSTVIGDVTGIEPVPNRNVVYVCQGGLLRVYDTTTDQLKASPPQPTVSGQAIDVKVVDF